MWFTPTERFYLIFGKLCSVGLGLACIGMAYLAANLGSILEAGLAINNIIGGSHFAIYILGFVNPWANRWGAHGGFLLGLSFSCWIYIGSKTYPPPKHFTKLLETEVVGCLNSTFEEWCPIEEEEPDVPTVANLYWISYMLLGTAGFVVTIITGSLISFLTGAISH